MLKRLLVTLLAFPIGALLVTLAVANRQSVVFTLDPFNPEEPALALNLPLYAYIFAGLIIGVVLGGIATWLTQGQWRRAARVRGQEAKRWHAEADRLTRERDASVAGPQKRLAAAGR
ncbi:MAG: hypothetical protein ACT4N2_01835 [Hyphomicrobium sp.]